MRGARGLRDEFTAFHALAYPQLAAQTVAITGDAEVTRAAAAATLARVWRSWSSLRNTADVLVRVRWTAVLIAAERESTTPVRSQQASDAVEELTGAAVVADAVVVAALQRLPRVQRRALVLHYMGGVSVRHLSALSGSSAEHIELLLDDGFRALAGSLEWSEPHDLDGTDLSFDWLAEALADTAARLPEQIPAPPPTVLLRNAAVVRWSVRAIPVAGVAACAALMAAVVQPEPPEAQVSAIYAQHGGAADASAPAYAAPSDLTPGPATDAGPRPNPAVRLRSIALTSLLGTDEPARRADPTVGRAPQTSAAGGRATGVAERGRPATPEEPAPAAPVEPAGAAAPAEPAHATTPTQPARAAAPTQPERAAAPAEPAYAPAPGQPAPASAPTEPAAAPAGPAPAVAPMDPVSVTAQAEPAYAAAPAPPAGADALAEPANAAVPTPAVNAAALAEPENALAQAESAGADALAEPASAALLAQPAAAAPAEPTNATAPTQQASAAAPPEATDATAPTQQASAAALAASAHAAALAQPAPAPAPSEPAQAAAADAAEAKAAPAAPADVAAPAARTGPTADAGAPAALPRLQAATAGGGKRKAATAQDDVLAFPTDPSKGPAQPAVQLGSVAAAVVAPRSTGGSSSEPQSTDARTELPATGGKAWSQTTDRPAPSTSHERSDENSNENTDKRADGAAGDHGEVPDR